VAFEAAVLKLGFLLMLFFKNVCLSNDIKDVKTEEVRNIACSCFIECHVEYTSRRLVLDINCSFNDFQSEV